MLCRSAEARSGKWWWGCAQIVSIEGKKEWFKIGRKSSCMSECRSEIIRYMRRMRRNPFFPPERAWEVLQ